MTIFLLNQKYNNYKTETGINYYKLIQYKKCLSYLRAGDFEHCPICEDKINYIKPLKPLYFDRD